tara:strand:- start:2509 stop:4113 length:1605 start_codon:yes stop_codon:yes gene_type:complete
MYEVNKNFSGNTMIKNPNMLKQFTKAIASFILLFSALALQAQKTEFETIGIVPESKRDFNKVLNFFEFEESYVVLNSPKTNAKELFFVDKKSGAVLKESELEDYFMTGVGMGIIKNQFVIIGLEPEEDEFYNNVVYYCFNPKGELLKKGVLLKEMAAKGQLREKARAYFDPMGNFLVLKSKKESEPETIYTAAFDAELSLLNETNETFQSVKQVAKSLQAAKQELVFDEEGNFFSLAEDRSGIRLAQRIDGYTSLKIRMNFDALGLGEGLGLVHLNKLNQDSLLISALVMKEGEPEREYSYVGIGKLKFFNLLGYYNMLYSIYDQELISEKIVYFSEEEKKAWPLTHTAAEKYRVSFSQSFDQRILPLENSNYLSITEHRNLILDSFIRDFLIITRHEANGDIIWTKNIAKYQGTPSEINYQNYYFFTSFSSVIADQQLKLIFSQRNDTTKGNIINKPQISVMTKRDMKKAQHKIISIDLKTGETLTEELANYEENYPRFLRGEFSEDLFPAGPYILMRDFELDRDVVVKLKSN